MKPFPTTMIPLISVIIPVFNEAENIRIAIDGIEKSLSIYHEILVVYDYPQDNTIPIINSIYAKNKNIKLVFNKKKGLINAIKEGFLASKADFVVIFSPDLADDPSSIQRMFEKMKLGYDIVSASRYSKGGRRINQNSIKLLLSKTAGKLSPLLLGIPTSDITNGFKMYRKSFLKTVSIESTGGWEFTLELMVKAKEKGFAIGEVGTVSRNRKFGKSKFKLFHWLPKYIHWYVYGLKLRLN